MKNGKKIEEAIYNLHNQSNTWEQEVLDEDENMSEEIDSNIRDLLNLLKKELKTEPQEEVAGLLLENGLQEKTVEVLMENALNQLQFYFSFEPLRNAEKRDRLSLQGLINIIYQKYIIRFEPGALEKLLDDNNTPSNLIDIASRIEFLTDYYVKYSFSFNAILTDLMDETGLDDGDCRYWAQIIEDNYTELRLNHIIRELRELNGGNG